MRPQVSRVIRALLALSAGMFSLMMIVFTPAEFYSRPKPPKAPVYLSEARAYVIETSSPGYTMTLQGTVLAIGRLHREFVVRLANAIREERSEGLSFAGVLTAYGPHDCGITACYAM